MVLQPFAMIDKLFLAEANASFWYQWRNAPMFEQC
jgi:hypothetical protein